MPCRVFIAYKGRDHGPEIARSVSDCVAQAHGMYPLIALPDAQGEIPFNDERRIFKTMKDCDAFVAVNTKGQCSTKFLDECSYARWDLEMPFVAVIETGSRPAPPLRIEWGKLDSADGTPRDVVSF